MFRASIARGDLPGIGGFCSGDCGCFQAQPFSSGNHCGGMKIACVLVNPEAKKVVDNASDDRGAYRIPWIAHGYG